MLGLFTYGGTSPSNNEIDLEPSHWGSLANPTGSATVWEDAAAGRSTTKTFRYSSHPPYVNQFTWSPRRVHFLVTDATGRRLLDWTRTTGVPVPSTEVPVINYWRFEDVPPAAPRSVRLSDFTWLALPVTRAVVRTDPPRAAVGWTARAAGVLRFAIRKRVPGRGWVLVERCTRRIRRGPGKVTVAGAVLRHRLSPGRYVLDTRGQDAGVRARPRLSGFTVVAR